MILIQRIIDNAIMNDLQGSDWDPTKLIQKQDDYDALPENTAQDIKDRYLAQIATLTVQRDAWYQDRLTRAAVLFGGVSTDYRIRQVDPAQKAAVLIARYLEEVDGELVIHPHERYAITGSTITVFPQWVHLNERLLEADVTDFSSLVLTEPLFFRLVFARVNATQEMQVFLLTRQEDEEFSPLPGNLTYCLTIVEGRLNIDLSITQGVF